MNYMGYRDNEQHPNASPINLLLNSIFWIGTWFYSLPAAVYFFVAAQTFLEYSDSFYFIVDGFLFVIIWVIFLYLKLDMLELIEDFEQMIQERKWIFWVRLFVLVISSNFHCFQVL